MSPRLPLASADDLQAELELIQWERDRMGMTPFVNQETRQNKLDSLEEWETDLRRQLAEMTEAAR